MASVVPRTRLLEGVAGLPVDLTTGQIDRLLEYLELLIKWNRAYNLTAVRDPAAMITRHILDSLAIAPLLRGERFIDVGTGAGLPGVPLAIALGYYGGSPGPGGVFQVIRAL